MDHAFEFFVRHGDAVVFAWIFAEQAGLPIPTIPLLLAVGSMANTGQIHLIWSLVLALAACLIADSFWYQMGRWHSVSVLRLLRRTSLVPASCTHHIMAAFRRHGACALLVAKFIPGLNFATPPLAGVSGVSLLRFLLFDSLASVFWAGGYMTLGYLFSGQFERLATYSSELGKILVAILIATTAALIGFNIIRSHRWLVHFEHGKVSRGQHKKGLPQETPA